MCSCLFIGIRWCCKTAFKKVKELECKPHAILPLKDSTRQHGAEMRCTAGLARSFRP